MSKVWVVSICSSFSTNNQGSVYHSFLISPPQGGPPSMDYRAALGEHYQEKEKATHAGCCQPLE
jgi:hypothetical protein